MQALSLIKDVISDKTLAVEFDGTSCLRRRLNSCDCSYCLDVCPAGALFLDNRHIQHDTRKCTHCMQCTAVCPNDAFSIPGYDLDSLFKSMEDRDLSVFSCARQAQIHPEEKVVPCMGMLTIEMLLVIGMKGPDVTAFNVAKCPECENKVVVDSFINSLTYLKNRAAALLNTRFSLLTHQNQINSLAKEGRRSFLSGITDKMISIAGSQFVQKIDTKIDTVSQNRRIPKKVQLIKKLIESVDNDQKALITSLCVYHLTASSDCTLCPLCTGICPTGALKVDRLAGEKQLLFRNTLCSGCGLCVTFCKQNAVRLLPPGIHKISKGKEEHQECLTVHSD
ncbi:MAG: 4Fe-4S binding protein [Deltaproteobacteria bacterium]|nr:4Fe-4S binding protein [Deltaproteobacteria bacterium]